MNNQHHRRERRLMEKWCAVAKTAAPGVHVGTAVNWEAVSGGAGQDMAIRGGIGRRYVTVGTERDRTILLRGFSAATNEARERGQSDCTEPCGVKIPAVSPKNPPMSHPETTLRSPESPYTAPGIQLTDRG